MLQGEEILSQKSQDSEEDDDEREQHSPQPQDESEDEVPAISIILRRLFMSKTETGLAYRFVPVLTFCSLFLNHG